MILDDNIIAGYYYLSTISETGSHDEEFEAESVKSSLHFIEDPNLKVWYQWYVEIFESNDRFPSFQNFCEKAGCENKCSLTIHEAQSIYYKQRKNWESNSLSKQLLQSDFSYRELIVKKLMTLHSKEVSKNLQPTSSTSFSAESLITTESTEKLFQFPIPELTENILAVPRYLISAIAPPRSGKTTFALNLAYLNSFLGSLRTCYIYLENSEEAYDIELRARHSITCNTPLTNRRIKEKFRPEESEAERKSYEKFVKINDNYKNNMKGVIDWIPFSKFDSDPFRFGSQLSHLIKEEGYDFVIFDYLQRASVFSRPRNKFDYYESLCSTFAQVCLGVWNSTPVIGLLLAQLNRLSLSDTVKKGAEGITLYSASGVPAIETDSFTVLSLYTDASMKQANEMGISILKNRDGVESISPYLVPYRPEYAIIGNVGFSKGELEDKVYSLNTVHSLADYFDI